MPLRALFPIILAVLAASTGAFAHPDHRDDAYVIDIRVGREAGRVEIFARVPLDLFTGVGLPLYGERFVDARAFRRTDPFDPAGRTYEERAVFAVRKAFVLEEEDGPIALTARSTHLSSGDDPAFGHYQAVRERMAPHVEDPPPVDVDAWHGYLDIHFVGAAGGSPLRFVPTLGSAVGSMVTFRFEGPDEEAASLPGDAPPVRLAPRAAGAAALQPAR